MSKFAGHVTSILLLLTLVSASQCQASYVDILEEAVANIEQGSYDAAASALERVCSVHDTDPLGHKVLGVIYLHTDRLDQAQMEFNKVVAAMPHDWQSHYALGLIAMLRARPADAEQHFKEAARHPAAQDELIGLRRYIGFPANNDAHQPSPARNRTALEEQASAMIALEEGDAEQAATVFSEMLRRPGRKGFRESPGPLATFDPRRPVLLPKGNLSWKPASTKEAPVVSDVLTLKADVAQTAGTSYVTFYVDDAFAGVTNYWPFQFDWNTRHHPNGLYLIRIAANSQWGSILSTKSLWVRVYNSETDGSVFRRGSAFERLTTRLWDCIRVAESRALAHYHLAKGHLDAGENDEAIRQLEYVVAYHPSLLDARKLLNDLRGRKAVYSEVSSGPSGMKRIALTFDDGPNERTMDKLRVLERLDVRATFFIVGMQAEAHPELLQAIHDAGHQIENHTYSHPRLTTLTSDQVEAELSRTAAIIRMITGGESVYFRPPGGHMNESAKSAAARQGLTSVFWTINCSPYESSDENRLARHVISNASDGGIVLMHNGEPVTTSALPIIAEELRSQGYEFVTISEMLNRSERKRTKQSVAR